MERSTRSRASASEDRRLPEAIAAAERNAFEPMPELGAELLELIDSEEAPSRLRRATATQVGDTHVLAVPMRALVSSSEPEYSLRVTASFGVAALPKSAGDGEELVAAADAALYRAKRGGKDRVEPAERVVAPG